MTSQGEAIEEEHAISSTLTGEAENTYKDVVIAALQARVAQLEEALDASHRDPEFRVLTRPGINHRWHERPSDVDTVIFFDIDHIHNHNLNSGYANTDAHIRSVMSQISHVWLFRWFSGDEFGLLCTAADASGFAARVERLLLVEGMTATFGIAPIINNDLKDSMSRAATLVQIAKSKDLRGTVTIFQE